MGHAAHDVVLVEMSIIGYGLCETFHSVSDALLQPPAPRFLLIFALRIRHRGGGCHDGWEGTVVVSDGDTIEWLLVVDRGRGGNGLGTSKEERGVRSGQGGGSGRH